MNADSSIQMMRLVLGLPLRTQKMSQLQLETFDRFHGITVRVKTVNLRPSGFAGRDRSKPALAEGFLGTLASNSKEHGGRRVRPEVEQAEAPERRRSEICMKTQRRIPAEDFESHIEHCVTCSNRVELQLDFMDTLAVAVHQRRDQPKREKMQGALLVSAPVCNFAICGEIETG
jgi:hypothetical protein